MPERNINEAKRKNKVNDMEYNFSHMREVLKSWNLELSEHQEQQFLLYYEMLIEKNKVMNLTAITEFDEVIEKHFLDSISLCTILNLNEKLSILDMGTGAGFPGIPLKIMFPELEITLADSLNKRILFLEDVIQELGLNGITAVHARAEELARNKDYREQFDVCVSRAVANLATLSEYCLPFIATSGKFVSYKAGEVENEVEAAKKAVFLLGGSIEEVKKFNLPGSEIHRSFIVIEKHNKTPKAYPRKAGTPAKTPLG